MAAIKAFNALRFTPKAGNPEELVCPPYDLLDEREREAFLARNKHNIACLELPREGPDPYAQAGGVLQSWLENSVLAADETPGMYFYEAVPTPQEGQPGVTGLYCMVRLEEFENGVILPHQYTMPKPKADRFNLMCACGCNFSSIHSLYSDKEGKIYPRLRALAEGAPVMEFSGCDGTVHKVWKIGSPAEISEIAALFADKKLHIADGPHRYETALSYRNHLRAQKGVQEREADYVMMTLTNMEHPGLNVFPMHRIVRDLKNFDAEKLLENCGEYFALQKAVPGELQNALAQTRQDGEKMIGLCLPETAYLLCLRDLSIIDELMPDTGKVMRSLDVNILHNLVLERFLGIDRANMAYKKNLTYTHSAPLAVNAALNGRANCAFLLGAPRLEDIAAIASAGERLPQKSTYFYPSLIAGHIMAMVR